MFDKVFRMTPNKNNRVMKKTWRKARWLNEVDRCQAIHQRDQYRLLIEQYRNKSLAETANIFCKNKPKPSVESQKKDISVIDLIASPAVKTLLSNYTGKEKSQAVPVQLFKSREPLTSSSLINRKPGVSSMAIPNNSGDFKTQSKPSPLAIAKSKSNSPKETTNKKTLPADFHTPRTKPRSPVDWFSPSSPYLARNFVPDLVNTYSRRERERKRVLHEEETRARLLKDKREMKEEQLSLLLQQRLKVASPKEEVVPELSDEAEQSVENALVAYPPQGVLVEEFNISITREHMATLSGLNWLNDEVINFYMELIVKRSKEKEGLPSAHAMNTFFYPKLLRQGYKSVRRWTKKADVFSKDLLIFPVHMGVHWTLAIADFRTKQLGYYDSMGGPNEECLATLKQYLASEHMDKKKSAYDVSVWKTECKDDIPQQMNGSDCGVFTCTFAEFLSRDAPLGFGQSDMPLLRRTMVWEILNKNLTR